MNPPLLQKGMFSVLMAESKTGHLLRTDGCVYLGEGEVYRLFNNVEECKSLITQELKYHPNREYIIYDNEGEGLFLINNFEARTIKK